MNVADAVDALRAAQYARQAVPSLVALWREHTAYQRIRQAAITTMSHINHEARASDFELREVAQAAPERRDREPFVLQIDAGEGPQAPSLVMHCDKRDGIVRATYYSSRHEIQVVSESPADKVDVPALICAFAVAVANDDYTHHSHHSSIKAQWPK